MPRASSKKSAALSAESNLKALNTKLLARLKAAEAQVAAESAARITLEKKLEEEKSSRAAVEDALATELAARQEAEREVGMARRQAHEACTKVEKAFTAVSVTPVPELSYSSVDTHSTVKRAQEDSPRSEASVSAGVDDDIRLQPKGFWARLVDVCCALVQQIVRRVQWLFGGGGSEAQPLLAGAV